MTEQDAEIRQLRERLADAEDTLRAIYHGAVDALVVRGPDGPQVFTLRGAQEPYRAVIEHMNEGALTIADDGTILYTNRHFADLMECSLEQVIGKPLSQFVAPHEAGALQALLADGASRSVRRELSFLRGDDSVIPALASAGPLVIDDINVLLLIVTDLTAQKQSEEVAAAERFSRSILEQATDAVLVCDRDGRITKTSWAAERLFNRVLVGQTLTDAVPFEIPDAAQAGPAWAGQSAAAFLDAVLGGKSFHGVEARIMTPDLMQQHFFLSAGPLCDYSARGIGCIVTLTDITDRKRAEEHQNVLVAELNHRVKNILAIVQSVAWQTLSSSASLAAFKDAFDGRLKALSLAHDILTQIRWGSVELVRLVEGSLAPYAGGERAGMATWSGPSLPVPAKSVVPLAMVLHELSTNAAKYGAFSNRVGTVQVEWKIVDDGQTVCIDWIERGGPAPNPDTQPGFGSKLISSLIAYDLHGHAELRFEASGLHCTLSFPMPCEEPHILSAAPRPDARAHAR